MNVNRAFFDKNIVTPHLIQELDARVDPLWMRHHEMQQSKFSRPQRHRHAVCAHSVADRIESQPASFDHIISCLRRAPTQYCFDPSIELAWRKWFSDVIVGADLESSELVLLFCACGQHDYGNALGAAIGSQTACELDTRHTG